MPQLNLRRFAAMVFGFALILGTSTPALACYNAMVRKDESWVEVVVDIFFSGRIVLFVAALLFWVVGAGGVRKSSPRPAPDERSVAAFFARLGRSHILHQIVIVLVFGGIAVDKTTGSFVGLLALICGVIGVIVSWRQLPPKTWKPSQKHGQLLAYVILILLGGSIMLVQEKLMVNTFELTSFSSDTFTPAPPKSDVVKF